MVQIRTQVLFIVCLCKTGSSARFPDAGRTDCDTESCEVSDEVSLVQLTVEQHGKLAKHAPAKSAPAKENLEALLDEREKASSFYVAPAWYRSIDSNTGLKHRVHRVTDSKKPMFVDKEAPPPPCIHDIAGSCWAAGFGLAAGIKLTGVLSMGLMYYLVLKHRGDDTSPRDTALSENHGDGDAESSKKKRVYIDTLDGVRTFLILAVICAHYPLGLPDMEFRAHFFGWPMQFFFVLSGFVACVQQQAESDRFDWLSGVTYVVRRLARLLPLYQLALVFQYVLALYDSRKCQPIIAWLGNALLLQVFLPFRVCGDVDYAWTAGYLHWNGNNVAWFAACLVWFACLFPLLYNNRPRSLAWIVIAMLALLMTRAAGELSNPDWSSYGWGPHLYAMAPIRLLEYAAGMCAAEAAAALGSLPSWGNWRGWCWAFDVCFVILFGMVFVSLHFLHSDWTGSGDYHLTAICCLVCMAARLAAELPETSKRGLRGAILHRLFRSTALVYPAQFTYAAYIFQVSFMAFTDHGFPYHFWVHRFVLLWVFAIFVTKAVEEPIRLAVDARLKGIRPLQ